MPATPASHCIAIQSRTFPSSVDVLSTNRDYSSEYTDNIELQVLPPPTARLSTEFPDTASTWASEVYTAWQNQHHSPPSPPPRAHCRPLPHPKMPTPSPSHSLSRSLSLSNSPSLSPNPNRSRSLRRLPILSTINPTTIKHSNTRWA